MHNTNEYLAHYGILGQKWGVRRYQNYDGTLKNAGKKRNFYGFSSDRLKGIATRDEVARETNDRKALKKAQREYKKYQKESIRTAEKNFKEFRDTSRKSIERGESFSEFMRSNEGKTNDFSDNYFKDTSKVLRDAKTILGRKKVRSWGFENY